MKEKYKEYSDMYVNTYIAKLEDKFYKFPKHFMGRKLNSVRPLSLFLYSLVLDGATSDLTSKFLVT